MLMKPHFIGSFLCRLGDLALSSYILHHVPRSLGKWNISSSLNHAPFAPLYNILVLDSPSTWNVTSSLPQCETLQSRT